jgi:hypothetical protein
MRPATMSGPLLWPYGCSLPGIAATLAANVLAGIGSGTLGAVAAAWPALAFVRCYELLMRMSGHLPGGPYPQPYPHRARMYPAYPGCT